MKTLKLLFLILIFAPLTGCLTVPSSGERLSTADTLAQDAGFHRVRVHTAPRQDPMSWHDVGENPKFSSASFLLTAYSKILEPGKDLHVYIEGDGYAWVTRNRVSGDPTPRRPVALELAAQDPAPNVVYLARPCQYTPMEMNPICEETYWTDKRFSEEVIGSMNQAIDKFAKDAQSSGVHLIGYSGGGAVAVLVAVRRQDVKSLRTVAGNLDPNGLNEYHEVSQLDEASLNPMDAAGRLSAIPQYHFIGANDPIVPAFIAEHFKERSANETCVRIIKVSNADHVNGWAENWKELLRVPVVCGKTS